MRFEDSFGILRFFFQRNVLVHCSICLLLVVSSLSAFAPSSISSSDVFLHLDDNHNHRHHRHIRLKTAVRIAAHHHHHAEAGGGGEENNGTT
jgi:hypothetical protein